MGRTRTDAASVRTDVRARLCLYSRPLLVCVTSHHFIINGHANVVTFSEAGTQFGCADKVPLGVEPNEVRSIAVLREVRVSSKSRILVRHMAVRPRWVV